MGADCTGIDLSDAGIKLAKQLNDELGLNSKFVCCNVLDVSKYIKSQFDIVFTSYGTIAWLPNLKPWAQIIYERLKVGGVFYIVEFHPLMCTFNDDSEIFHSYFQSQAIETAADKSYTDASEVTSRNLKYIEWNHSLGELTNGLNIEFLNEFPYQVYNCFPNLTEKENGRWVSNKYGDKILHMYSVRAKKI